MKSTETPIRRGRPKTRDKEHVLQTAMTAYWHEDQAATTINGICELAGVSKPSLYRDFGSEDGLTAAVLEQYSDTVLRQVGELLLSEASFSSKLAALIQFASEAPQMESGCLFVKMRAKRSRFGPLTQSFIAQVEKDALNLYERFFTEARAQGEWSGTAPIALTTAYFHEQFGLAFTQRASGKSPETVKGLLTLALSAIVPELSTSGS